MLSEVVPTFLYPRSRQYPIDEVCEQIVREMEKRNWLVPDITVELDTYGTGEEKFQMVRYIRGKNFKMWFCRVQGSLAGGQWNDIGAISEVVIPGEEINVYEDESGPTYYKYVGNHWEGDKMWFFSSSKIHAKLYKEPRRYLVYSGQHSLPDNKGGFGWYTPGRRPQYLCADSDLGRQYSPRGWEKKYYLTNEVLEHFRDWLEENVLKYIRTFSEQEVLPTHVATLPYPTDAVGPIFTFVDWRDAERIVIGKKSPQTLTKSERYGLSGGGWRLVTLSVPNDGTLSDLAYDGFLWCNVGVVSSDMSIDDLPKYLGSHPRWGNDHVVRITPKYSNGVYVAELATQEAYKEEIWRQNPKLERLTDEQFAEFQRIPGRTLVPITEYRGGYEQPFVLINRELDFDEVEVVIGPRLDRNN